MDYQHFHYVFLKYNQNNLEYLLKYTQNNLEYLI